MKQKIDFYEEVRIIDDIKEPPELRGKIGVVMGISEENGVVTDIRCVFPICHIVTASLWMKLCQLVENLNENAFTMERASPFPKTASCCS